MRTFALFTLWLSLVPSLVGCAANTAGEDVQAASASAALRESSLAFDVQLRGTIPVSIHARVWEGSARGGATVLAVPGLSETAAVYGPLATTILQDRVLRRVVRRVIAIEMPGHGESGVPPVESGLKFGDLVIEDNVSVVVQSIDALAQQRLAPSILIGHSMGGLEVQAAQQALLDQQSSLARHGIRRVLLLAPVPPHGRPWTVPQTGDLSSLVQQDPVLGTYVAFPPEVFIAQSFGTPAGTLVAGAPTPDEVMQAGYVGPEPLGLLLQLVEAPVTLPDGSMFTPARPSVDQGAFALRNGTLLKLASFSQDVLVPAADLAALYPYLTLDPFNLGYVPVETADAAHCMFISNPEGVLEALRGL